MIEYQIIPMADVICKFRKVQYDISETVALLNENILDVRCQWVFEPINVVRYKKGGLRSVVPPFEYHIIDNASAKKYWIHMALGLTVIRAKLDTTFRDGKEHKPKNPFPKTWTINLGMTPAQKKQEIVQQKREANKNLKVWNRQEKWMEMLTTKKLIKLTTAKVAVILTSYNRPTLVQKAIKSVLNQQYKNFKLYIVDNNSNPNVKAILRWYKRKYPKKIVLHFLKTPNSQRLNKCWLSYMINWAIRRGREPYITLLTDDCWFEKTRLVHMVGNMDKNPSWMICYGTQVVVDKHGHHLLQRRANKVIPPHGGPAVIDHNQILFRRKLIAEIGYWNESPIFHVMNAPDAEFFRRIPYPIMPIPIVTDWFLKHGKSFQRYLQSRKHKLTSGEVME